MNPSGEGLVFKAHRLLYHSALGSKVTKKKKQSGEGHKGVCYRLGVNCQPPADETDTDNSPQGSPAGEPQGRGAHWLRGTGQAEWRGAYKKKVSTFKNLAMKCTTQHDLR